MNLWPHQIRGIEQTQTAIESGERAVCLTSPTGGGKSVMICRLLEWAQERGMPSVLYTNRKLLTEQMIGTLTNHGIPFGVRAAGFSEYENLDAPIQISSLQTEDARVFKSQKWMIHKSGLVIVDEAHLQKGPTAQQVFDLHAGHDAARIGVTATPVGISKLYADRLIVAGTTSELRACGALVPANVYAPTEFDMKGLKPKQKTGEYSIQDIRKHIWTPTIFGNVYEHWKRLNPDARPTILFAPGVPESIWFAQQFCNEGVTAASIDGESVYVDGQTIDSDREARQDVLHRFRTGNIKVLCNRFVLREGIDIPEIYHCILATPIGSLVSYIQIVGRVLRAHPSTPEVLIQDHGGSWHRHGSPNADRDWASVFEVPENRITEKRESELREKKEPEPICCPKCGAIRKAGIQCHQCGYSHNKRTRMVIQQNGRLKEVTGDIYKPRKIKQAPNTAKLWEQCYYRAFNSKNGMTFNQAEALFFREHHYYPPRTLPLMPAAELDWHRKVKNVPKDGLIRRDSS